MKFFDTNLRFSACFKFFMGVTYIIHFGYRFFNVFNFYSNFTFKFQILIQAKQLNRGEDHEIF